MVKIFLILCLFISFQKELFSQSAVNSVEVYNVLENVIVARGGKDYLKSIKTFYAEMKIEANNEIFNTVTKEMVPNKSLFKEIRNGKIVYESRNNGVTSFTSVDGHHFKQDSTVLPATIHRKNIFTELDYVDSSLWKMQLFGSEFVDKVECYKVKGTFVNGDARFLYIDKQTFSIIKEEKLTSGSEKIYLTLYYLDFKKFGAFFFYSKVYFVFDTRMEVTTFEKVLINESVLVSDFEM